MTPVRIAITGEFRRGKDTVADILTKHLEGENADRAIRGPITRLAFADELKRELADMTWMFVGRGEYAMSHAQQPSWDDHEEWRLKELAARQINGTGWQWWGEYRRQTVSEDYWVNHPDLQSKFVKAVEQGHHILLTDLRHHNELAWCKAHGFYCIRVEGPCRSETDVRDRNHPSEVHIRELDVNRTIYNGSSLEVLEHNVLNYALRYATVYCDEWSKVVAGR